MYMLVQEWFIAQLVATSIRVTWLGAILGRMMTETHAANVPIRARPWEHTATTIPRAAYWIFRRVANGLVRS